MSKILRVLSFDPGTRNFAYALTEHRIHKGVMQSRVTDNGLLRNVPLTFKDLPMKVENLCLG